MATIHSSIDPDPTTQDADLALSASQYGERLRSSYSEDHVVDITLYRWQDQYVLWLEDGEEYHVTTTEDRTVAEMAYEATVWERDEVVSDHERENFWGNTDVDADDTITMKEIISIMGWKDPASVRKEIRKWGLTPIGRGIGRGGSNIYRRRDFLLAHKRRPGQGARTDLKENTMPDIVIARSSDLGREVNLTGWVDFCGDVYSEEDTRRMAEALLEAQRELVATLIDGSWNLDTGEIVGKSESDLNGFDVDTLMRESSDAIAQRVAQIEEETLGAQEDTQEIWVTILDQPAPQIRGAEFGLIETVIPSAAQDITTWLTMENVGEGDTYALVSPYTDQVSWEIDSRKFEVPQAEYDALVDTIADPAKVHGY